MPIEKLHLSDISCALHTDKARQAFKTLNDLGASWHGSTDRKNGKVYLSPTIETKKSGGGTLKGIGGWSRNFNAAVLKSHSALIKQIKSGENLIVVNAANKYARTEYIYDATKKFVRVNP